MIVHSPTITASIRLLPSLTITTSVDLMLLGMECRWNERQAERGILKYLGKKNEVNRSLPMVISHGFWTDLITHKLWALQSKIQTHQHPSTKTTTSTKKSEWIKNPNPPTAFNQNHNLHQKIQANKLHHSLSLKPPQPQQKAQTQIFRLETQITKIRN